MRMSFTARVRRGEKVEYEDAIVWIGEVPPEYRPGRHREMKSRKFKPSRQRPLVEETPRRRPMGRRRD